MSHFDDPPQAVLDADDDDLVEPWFGRRWSRGDTLRVLVAGLVLAVTAVIAHRGLPGWEEQLFESINRAPDRLYPVVWPFMQLGNVIVGVLVAVAIGVAARRTSVGITTLGAVLTAWVLAKVIKDIVGRARPGGLDVSLELRGGEELGLGYISGHAAIAFALFAMVGVHLQLRGKVIALVLALGVCLARVYIGAHLPLDVIGGAACGLLIGETWRAIETWWRSRGAAALSDTA